MVTIFLALSHSNIIVSMVTGATSPFSALLPFACHHHSLVHSLVYSLIPSFCSSAGETAARKLVPTSGSAQWNWGDRATHGLYIPQTPKEQLGLVTMGGSVEKIFRGHQAGRATIRRQMGSHRASPPLRAALCTPGSIHSLRGHGQRVRREGRLLPHYKRSLRTRDSLWHTFQSLTDLDFNPDFATPELRDFGHVISA